MDKSQRARSGRKAWQLAAMSMMMVVASGVFIPVVAYAGDPKAGGGEPASDKNLILPLTPEMQTTLAKKMLSFQATVASLSPSNGAGATVTAVPQSYTLSTYARHQRRWFYCGPATVQVISNYTWGYYLNATSESATGNKYKQSTISATWTKTDVTQQQTYLGNLINGMNGASQLPFAGFYMQWNAPAWSDFQHAIATDTSTWYMPLAAGVSPRKTGSPYYLYSWRSAPAGNWGHYIPLRGYSGFFQSSALAYYNDSSGGTDEVTGETILGSTGAFQDLSFTVYKTMMNQSGNLVW
jgi:hypothetical protein